MFNKLLSRQLISNERGHLMVT